MNRYLVLSDVEFCFFMNPYYLLFFCDKIYECNRTVCTLSFLVLFCLRMPDRVKKYTLPLPCHLIMLLTRNV